VFPRKLSRVRCSQHRGLGRTVARMRACTPFIRLILPSSLHSAHSTPLSVAPSLTRPSTCQRGRGFQTLSTIEPQRQRVHHRKRVRCRTCSRVRATSIGLVATVATIPAVAPATASSTRVDPTCAPDRRHTRTLPSQHTALAPQRVHQVCPHLLACDEAPAARKPCEALAEVLVAPPPDCARRGVDAERRREALVEPPHL